MTRFATRRRYLMQYGSIHHTHTEYCVYDRVDGVVVFKSDSKSNAIAKAQELNHLSPIDGSEETYGRQIEGDQ